MIPEFTENYSFITNNLFTVNFERRKKICNKKNRYLFVLVDAVDFDSIVFCTPFLLLYDHMIINSLSAARSAEI
jgi:hypothetical protein